jgi:6-phosphogluconolactonase
MKPVVETHGRPADIAAATLVRLRDALSGTQGQHLVCLSGGHTPEAFYRLLAEEIRSGRLPVGRVHWFVGDERAVPFDHPRSNFGMLQRTLFDAAGIPAEHVHPMPANSVDLEAAAGNYEGLLQGLYGATDLTPARPLFSFTLLGLGEDGHTASLFPGAETLAERRRWVVPAHAPDGEPRMTLTIPALDSSRHTVVLVEGRHKREALARWLRDDAAIPAARLHPIGGIVVLADGAAAGA